MTQPHFFFFLAFLGTAGGALLAPALCSAQDETARLARAPLFDDAAEGGIWARGDDYKAHFGPHGSTFIPFLGSHAPRNFPASFRLEAVSVGGRALELHGNAAPERAGQQISFERGPLTELYQVEAGLVEQLFYFGSVPEGGDLVLRIGVETELAARECSGGLLFEGEWGGLRYGEVVALDARGELLRTAPVLVDGGIELRIPHEALARARGPLTIDPLISTFHIDSTAPDDRNPDVAYDASLDIYVVVWERIFSQSDTDAHGKVLDASGAVVQQFLIDATPGPATAPKVAGIDALDHFLTVYRNQGGLLRRVLTVQGGILSVGASMGSSGGNTHAHALGGDATDSPPFAYLIASQWSAFGSFLDCIFVMPSGEYGSSFFFSDGGDSGYFAPQIAKSAGGPPGGPKRWILGFDEWEYFQSHFVRSYTVSMSGPDYPGTIIWSGSDLGGVSSPLESADGTLTYLVVGPGTADTGSTVRARLVRGGQVSGPIMPLHSDSALDARVETDGASFVVSHTVIEQPGVSERVYATTLSLSGDTVAITEQVPLSPSGRVSRGSALVSTRGLGGAYQRFLVAWHLLTAGNGDIIGALYDTPGVGVPYCVGAPNSVGPGARIGATGSISIAANAFQLFAEGCPPNQPGLFYLGENEIQIPFGEGFRCIGGSTARIVRILSTDAQGAAAIALDFDLPYGDLVFPGAPGLSYQFWYRDPSGGPSNFNLSDALRVQHTP